MNNDSLKPKVTHDDNLSKVVAFTGPRGSGKTLCLTYYAALYLLEGYKVWSNYKVSFKGNGKQYESLPLDMVALYTFDEELRGGLVCIDELNIWANSRRSSANPNNLLNAIFQQIRHRKLSFFFTVQDFTWVDKRIRWQVDGLYKCRDVKYTQWGMEQEEALEPGELISLRAFDLSGIFSGYTYEESGNSSSWLLKGKLLWDFYDTEAEFDVLGSMANVAINAPKMTINVGNDGQVYAGSKFAHDKEMVKQCVNDMRGSGLMCIESGELIRKLSEEYQVIGDARVLARHFKPLGLNYRQGRKGNFYDIGEGS